MAVVEVRDLRKRYGGLDAVAGISFDIEEGEVYGLLGHNGAGKSTTVEILEGHRTRTSGDVSVLGLDPAKGGRELRDRVGIVLQTSGVEHEMTVREAIGLYGSVYRRRRPTDELIDLVGLDDKADARIGTLSGGQRRRLDLALGIVGYPDLVFLDEPTTGFDPAARRKSWELIQGLCSLGTTVLLTTHYLDEAEHLADRVGVLTNGQLVAEGTPDELIGGLADTIVSFSVDAAEFDGLRPLLPDTATIDGTQVRFPTATPTEAVHRITGWAVERRVELQALSVARPSLEDVFLDLAAEGDDESELAL
jgi:ABC-2 type transport system ATP-binding protein